MSHVTLEWDPVHRVATLVLQPGRRWGVVSRRVAEGVVLDLDRHGQAVAVELLDVTTVTVATPDETTVCQTSGRASRTCERGTAGCVVRHG